MMSPSDLDTYHLYLIAGCGVEGGDHVAGSSVSEGEHVAYHPPRRVSDS